MCIAVRPLNRILIAQRVASPQMFVSIGVAALHVGVNHLLVNTLGLGFLGAAWAIGIASFNTTLFTAMWVAVAGMQDRVWGRPTWGAFQVFAALWQCVLSFLSEVVLSHQDKLASLEPDQLRKTLPCGILLHFRPSLAALPFLLTIEWEYIQYLMVEKQT